MIPILDRDGVRAIDTDAVERLKLPSLALMENAGRGATEVLLSRLGDHLRRVVIVGGVGQNGGDAWVVARHLYNRGIEPFCVLVGDEEKVKGDAATNLAVLRALGVGLRVVKKDDLEGLERAVSHASLLVDGIFGTGLDRPIEGGYAEAVKVLNRDRAPVFALDMPSGIDADTGQVLGVAVEAAVTATFAAHKRGLHQHPGVDHAGEVVWCSIGIPPPGDEAPAQLFELDDVGRALPIRALDAHKGRAGHVLVVAGAPGRTGAAVLSGHGALRGGAGLVTLAGRGAARAALDQKVVEMMTASLPEGAEAIEEALGLADGLAAAVVGPGLGLDEDGRRLAIALAEKLPIPTVLDADALTALSDDPRILRGAAAPRVLTPHPGEASRLLDRSASDIQADRYDAAATLAERTGQVVVLKGARTVVAAPDGRLRVCRHGAPALGVAGTGDILSGVVAAQLAGLQTLSAASVAVVLHARAGERAARSDRGLLAREVGDALPLALEEARAAAREVSS